MNKLILVIISSIVTYFIYKNYFKAQFNDRLGGTKLTNDQPLKFPPVSPETVVPEFIPLAPPVVPEEIGLAMVYPQGAGVGMSKLDSNAFEPGNPGPLLTDYTVPQSYGESSLSDPTGANGSDQGARILKIKSAGQQLNYKPNDEAVKQTFSAAYSTGQVQDGTQFVNGNQFINYSDDYNPSSNLMLQAAPGQASSLSNCETTYPNTVKYNDFCITQGDIPYGQTVDNKVNPRLVSRWQSFTGDYSREEALAPIDGTLYPTLGVLASA